ncbi:OmpH family outer membrane protein [Sulfitobacter aestuarii]|uniref:OmpH family outer membrane protein n=1 Tax=Sulfitobacter aestuarii TaxID=2161676 RepID=A0ABW5U2V4_9RHOB
MPRRAKRPMRLLFAVLMLSVPVQGAAPLQAQQQAEPGRGDVARAADLSRGSIVSPILTIDSDRVFQESAFGRRVAQEIEQKSAALSAENRQIEADLEAEEKILTEKRNAMTPEKFREAADAFDQKVQKIRQAQAAKSRELNQIFGDERGVFLNAAAPVLERLMADAGAAVVLDLRSVFVSANAIDITDEAIDRLDETLGRGTDVTP